jgi:hypothetical protein
LRSERRIRPATRNSSFHDRARYRKSPAGDVFDEEQCGAYTNRVKDISSTNPMTGKTNP